VLVPAGAWCCGRPLYDYGFLGMARRWLRRALDALRPALRTGTPVVVLEPSCAAVFKDELTNLLPADEDARRLHSQIYLLADFLRAHAPQFRPPRLSRAALLHGHCHHKAVLDFDAEEQVLRDLGVELRMPDSGCCGMAGAFGFEAGDHYRVATACGERVLLPEVRAASDATIIIADGFSCREQIVQGTGREALHLAEVLRLALRTGAERLNGGRPEAALLRERRREQVRAGVRAALLAGGGIAVGAAISSRRRHR
jgi:Fe-S oxidoreductase